MFEEENLRKAREGDLQSVEDICSATWKSIYRFIYYKVQNREEAEDITQETYVKALSHIAGADVAPEKYIGFLKTVSLNILRDKWRKRKRREQNVSFDAVSPEDLSSEDHAEASAQRELIRNAINALNEEQRTVVELRIMKGYSAAETARIMNKKEGTVRVIQYRALQALAAILENSD